jgi:hypothetical protein
MKLPPVTEGIDYVIARGPIAYVVMCKHCGYKMVMERGLPRSRRGWALASASHARGNVIRHIRAEHTRNLNDNPQQLST